MARLTGKNGQIKVGGNVIASISDWSLDMKVPTADATAMADPFASKLSLIREWSGTIKGPYDNAAAHIAILNSFINATTSGGATSGSITVDLYPDASTLEKWSGDCYVDFSLVVDKSKVNEFTAKITGTGALTHTANA